MNQSITPSHLADDSMRRAPPFIYRHVVCFEETNVVGNVYFTRHVSWQGRCREMFLKQHVPTLLDQIARDLRLVTLRVSSEYFEELNALDDISVEMRLSYLRQHRIGLDFDIVKLSSGSAIRAARGFQEIACMRATATGLVPIEPPAPLLQALKPFAGG
ncbi:acyl-CoA thioesterase [Bradyrhizobium sp. SZCCHNRI1029]|uniref:acyl-CoA thioesterase n=1 Tax=Bradyrhizobium sp. SZCCHNRI1029 TaxID=3057278 RepID=UPI00291672F7|nr:acyl-CoA thioesterase [Bradyrhizobium sp. SZCCHNRI1029]